MHHVLSPHGGLEVPRWAALDSDGDSEMIADQAKVTVVSCLFVEQEVTNEPSVYLPLSLSGAIAMGRTFVSCLFVDQPVPILAQAVYGLNKARFPSLLTCAKQGMVWSLKLRAQK